MELRNILIGTAAALAFGTASHAATLSVEGERNDLQLTADNDFIGAASDDFLTGLDFIVNASVQLSGAATLRFTAWGAESGFDNCLNIGPSSSPDTTVCESDDGFANETFNAASGSTRQTFDVAYSGGAITDWFFTTQTGSPVTGGGDLGEFDFGIFFAGSDPSDDTELMGSGLSHIFIAYDDKAGTGAGLDDNHDDYVWKVEVVPLPAAGWLLLAGMGGLAAMKRRKKA